MTQAEALSRVRNLLHETAAGFWLDSQIYQYLDSGLHLAVQYGLGVLEKKKQKDKFAQSIILQPLHTLDSSTTTVAGTQEYSLASDFLITDFCEYTPDDRVNAMLPCVLIDYAKMRHQNMNPYLLFTATNPAYYIRSTKIGFYPIPVTGGAGSNRYNHYYYKQPSTISSGTSGSEIPLKLEAHEAIVHYAMALALIEDSRANEAELQNKYALEILSRLE